MHFVRRELVGYVAGRLVVKYRVARTYFDLVLV